MIKLFDRQTFFDAVRGSIFHGAMTQSQVNGMEAILAAWEEDPRSDNLRHLSYPFATTYHETGATMQPIEEYGKGSGMAYGSPDPETKQTYYGRGYVQLTWRDNYARADKELYYSGEDSCEWHAAYALEPDIAAEIMFQGMTEGWFRSDDKGKQTLERYFSETTDDSYGAREIINGDKHIVPSWSGGISIGNLVKGYHIHFLAALEASAQAMARPPVSGTVIMALELRIDLANRTATAKVLNIDIEGERHAQGRDRPERPQDVGAAGEGENRKPEPEKKGLRRVPQPRRN